MKPHRSCLVAGLFVLLAASGACSPEEDRRTANPPEEETSVSVEDTVSLPTVQQTTPEETTDLQEGTLGASTETPDIVLRLEGAPRTRFSGLCNVGGEESVLSGQTPKRFTFDLDGAELSCRIQKQDQRNGNLRVILLSGSTTRSVQQTNTPGGTIQVSYEG